MCKARFTPGTTQLWLELKQENEGQAKQTYLYLAAVLREMSNQRFRRIGDAIIADLGGPPIKPDPGKKPQRPDTAPASPDA
jgi:hypothetical protein